MHRLRLHGGGGVDPMSGLRFKVGDLCQFVVARWPEGIPMVGTVIEISAVGPFLPGEPIGNGISPHRCNGSRDYAARYGDEHGMVCDFQLAPLKRPAEPLQLTHQRDEELETQA